MPLLAFTAAAALVYAIGDSIMIPLVMRPLFKDALGAQMLDTLRLGPAVAFYVIHIAGLVYFIGPSAIHGGAARTAAADGAMLGLIAYSCYEMTSWTIMRDWNIRLVVIDIAWGMLISGASAFAGAHATRFTRRAPME
jgi:uncharacterized membrane protein